MSVANFESIGKKAKLLFIKVCKAIPSSEGEGGGEVFCGGDCGGLTRWSGSRPGGLEGKGTGPATAARGITSQSEGTDKEG